MVLVRLQEEVVGQIKFMEVIGHVLLVVMDVMVEQVVEDTMVVLEQVIPLQHKVIVEVVEEVQDILEDLDHILHQM